MTLPHSILNRRSFCWLVGASLLPISIGCTIPYAYPHLDRIPSVPLGDDEQETIVLRLKYTISRTYPCGVIIPTCLTADELRSARVLQHTNKIPSQYHLGLARGVYLFAVALNHDFRTDDHLDLRLYRRGYETIIVDRDYDGGPLHWKPITTLVERELAVDALVSFGIDRSRPLEPESMRKFASGGEGRLARLRHLLVSEYSLLRTSDTTEWEARRRIRRKLETLCAFEQCEPHTSATPHIPCTQIGGPFTGRMPCFDP